MTWSFQIKNGDLNISGPGGYATVTGQQKLIQDLKNWLLTPRGTDPFNPDYGSILDGGVMDDGTVIESSIGTLITPEALVSIEAEIRRVLNAYQQQQLARLTREAPLYGGLNTFAAGEILGSVDDVEVTQVGAVVVCQVSITTGDGNAISFSQPLS